MESVTVQGTQLHISAFRRFRDLISSERVYLIKNIVTTRVKISIPSGDPATSRKSNSSIWRPLCGTMSIGLERGRKGIEVERVFFFLLPLSNDRKSFDGEKCWKGDKIFLSMSLKHDKYDKFITVFIIINWNYFEYTKPMNNHHLCFDSHPRVFLFFFLTYSHITLISLSRVCTWFSQQLISLVFSLLFQNPTHHPISLLNLHPFYFPSAPFHFQPTRFFEGKPRKHSELVGTRVGAMND